jgi:hypothetical protein
MTTLTSEHSSDQAHGSALGRARYAFRHWRWGRPFWGSLFVVIGGLEIIWIPYSPIGVVMHEGIAGVGGMFIGLLMIMFAFSAMFAPSYRVFAGIAAVLLALIALPATNLGGFLIGTLCALFGGSFIVAWAPRAGMTADTRHQLRKARKPARAEQAEQTEHVGEPVGADLAGSSGEQYFTEGDFLPYDATAPGAGAAVIGFSESEITAAELAAAAGDPERELEASQSSTDPED